MTATTASRIASSAILTVLVSGSALAHNEFFIGMHDGGLDVFKSEIEEPFAFENPVFPFPGVGGNPVGFVSVSVDEGSDHLDPLAEDADIALVITGLTPGLTLWTGLTPLGVGGMYPLGTPIFHNHPTFTIENGVVGEIYTISVFARDLSGRYADSPVDTVSFTYVPAPGAAALFGMLAVAAGRRRR